jgi:hypothetical protein
MKEVTEILGTSNRRSFIKNGAVAGTAATIGAGILGSGLAVLDETSHKGPAITKGDIAILEFLPQRKSSSPICGNNTPNSEEPRMPKSTGQRRQPALHGCAANP